MKMSSAARADLARLIRNRKYERTHDGRVFVPAAKLLFAGIFSHAVNGEDWQHDPNIVVNEGLDHFLDVTLSAATQLTTWYIAPFEGNYTPVATDTAAVITTNATESTAYSESVRQTWTEAGVSGQSITNSASTADFSINATKTMYGAFLISSDVKGGTSGTLIAASKFAASRSVVNLDTLSITYTLNAADA